MKNDILILRFVIVKKFYKISPRKIHGAMTLSIMTFNIKTLSITTFSIKTLSIMTFNIKTLSITSLSIRTQHNEAQHDN